MCDYRLTTAQKGVLRMIASGLILKKVGRGYAFYDGDKWVGKASIAVKSLAADGLIAKASDRIFFTTRGWDKWHGGLPSGDNAVLCAQADERLAYVQSMMVGE